MVGTSIQMRGELIGDLLGTAVRDERVDQAVAAAAGQVRRR